MNWFRIRNKTIHKEIKFSLLEKIWKSKLNKRN